MNLKRLKDNLLHINNLRKFLGYEIFRQATASSLKLEIIKTPPEGRVLILSPHLDDDVIGCGGIIKLHIQKDDQVKIVYLADGSGGLPKNKIFTRSDRRRLAQTREKEAKEATLILGVDEPIFWRYQDGHFSANSTTIKLLENILSTFSPDIIYLPSFLDPHPDHLETCKIFYQVLPRYDFAGQIFSFEIWSPIYANRLVNIDKVIDYKKRALLAHKSQLSSRGYLEAIMGLNQYRAGMYNAGKYAEGFFACNKKLYLQLFELLNLRVKK